MIFKDRIDGANELNKKLKKYKNKKNVLVLGLARGGVPVAAVVADFLGAAFDAIIVRKIGSPFNPEYAIGAMAEDGSIELDKAAMQSSGLTEESIKDIIQDEKQELKRRIKLYRKSKPLKSMKNKIVILVDDGIATGKTMKAAIKTVTAAGATKIVVAVPVLTASFLGAIVQQLDDIVYVRLLAPYNAIGAVYENFPQTSDEEVINLLSKKKKKIKKDKIPRRKFVSPIKKKKRKERPIKKKKVKKEA